MVVAGYLLIMHLQGQRLLAVQTASMQPTLRPGDAVLVKPVAASQLHAGEIISYISARDPTLVITHRLVKIDDRTKWLTTSGDALHTLDPTFPPRLVLGQVTAVAPGLGVVLDSLRKPVGLMLAVYVPALLAIASEVKRLLGHYKSQHYQLYPS